MRNCRPRSSRSPSRHDMICGWRAGAEKEPICSPATRPVVSPQPPPLAYLHICTALTPHYLSLERESRRWLIRFGNLEGCVSIALVARYCRSFQESGGGSVPCYPSVPASFHECALRQPRPSLFSYITQRSNHRHDFKS